MRGRGWLQIPRRGRTYAALVLAPLLVLAGLSIGPRIGPFGLLSPLPDADPLDYASRPGSGFSPLSARFVSSVLGDGTGSVAGGFGDIGGPPGLPAAATVVPGATAKRLTDVHPLTNDDIADAREVAAIPYTARTNDLEATREPNEPSDCGSVGGTVWYRYTPSRDIALVAYTFGTDHAVSLAAFSETAGNLEQLRCDTDTSGNTLVAFPAKARYDYYFQITSPVGRGNLVFSLDPLGATSLTTRSSSGERANGETWIEFSFSGDGRFVAFSSTATNLARRTGPEPCAARDPVFAPIYVAEPCPQIYIRDRSTGTTELVSVTPSGEPGNGASVDPFVSSDGRYVTYESSAANLDPSDADGGYDLFVHDRRTGRTEKIPASSSSSQSEFVREQYQSFYRGSISDDGRYVVFASPASDLVPGDTNGAIDVFVYDRQTRRTERVSVSSSGREMTGRARDGGLYPSISADGRYVEFMSDSPTLVPGDTNGLDDIFLHDRLTHKTERVSVSSSGRQGNNPATVAGHASKRVSADGRYVAFISYASNLVPGDTNNGPDVFVRDRVARTTIRISVSSAGDEARVSSNTPWTPSFVSVSGDGRYVAFDSTAVNLAPGDRDRDWDVFVHDLFTETTMLVTLDSSGKGLSGQGPVISADARAVAYVSDTVDRGGDTSGKGDVFVYEAPRLR